MKIQFIKSLLILWLLVPIAAVSAKVSTFKINLRQSPPTINPLSSTGTYASKVQAYVLEGLLERDIETFVWKPALASAWETAKDGLSYTFTLKDNLKWHDGKPITIADVKFSFDAIMEPDNKYKTAHMRFLYENIKEAKIIGKNKITFFAKKKYFKNFEVCAGLTIIPKHLYENPSKKQKKKLNKTLVGSGPYILKKFKRGKSIVLVKNKNWWGHTEGSRVKENNFDKILIRFVKDTTIAIQRAEKGDIDYLETLSAEDYVKKTTGKKWGVTIDKYKVQNLVPVNYGFVGWNLKHPLFKSVKMRKALALLLNRKEMAAKFRFGLSLLATGPLYRQSPYANKSVTAVPFKPEDALSLLKEEGWSDSDKDQVLDKMVNGKKVDLRFTILEPNKEFMKYLTIYKEDAKKVGVDIKLKFVEWNTFLKLLDERKFEAVRLGWGGGSIDWDPKQIWHSESVNNKGSNFIGYSNKKVDKLIEISRVTLDRKKRIEYLSQVYKLIADDYPYAFFFNDKYKFYGANKRLNIKKDTYKYGVGSGFWTVTK